MSEVESRRLEPELVGALITAAPFAAALVTHVNVLVINELMRRRFGHNPPGAQSLLSASNGLLVSELNVTSSARYYLVTGLPESSLAQHIEVVAREWKLTLRECEVLQLLAEGPSTRAIAARLEVGTRTVESHIARLLLKSQCESRSEVIARLWQRASAKPFQP